MGKHITSVLFTCLLFGGVSFSSAMDDTGLKDWLVNNFLGYEGLSLEDAAFYKKRLAVTDEQLHSVLMNLYGEAENRRATLKPETQEWKDTRRIEFGVINLLSLCGDVPVKAFLLDYIDSKEKDPFAKNEAIRSYLRVADAEETKNMLLRFLVGEEQMDLDGRFGILSSARLALKGANAGKKAAILESLYVGLSRERNKCAFRVYDNILCDFSRRYANSHQRLALLQRLIDAPSFCKADDYAMPELNEKLKTLKKTRFSTNISTNLTVLLSKDFNLPQTEMQDEASSLKQTSMDAKTDMAKSIPLLIGFFAVAALTVVTGFWLYRRKHAM